MSEEYYSNPARAHPHAELSTKELKKLCDSTRGGSSAGTPIGVVIFFILTGVMSIWAAYHAMTM